MKALADALAGDAEERRCYGAYFALHLGTFFALAGPALMKALADTLAGDTEERGY